MARISVRVLSVAGATALAAGTVALAGPLANAGTHPAHASHHASHHAKAAGSSYTLVTEPTDTYTPVYNLIKSAKKSVDMTMYELTDTTAEQALADAKTRGVTVRVILDQNREQAHNTDAYNFLTGKGIKVVWAEKGYAATHQKTVTVDGATSAVMSGNLTSQYYKTSRDFAVIENDPADVAAIEKVFEADFSGGQVTPGDGTDLVWSPTDSQKKIMNVINSATKSLSIENEEMGDATVVTALENQAKKGVNVQVTMTNQSDHYKTQFDALVKAGVHVHTYDYNASLYIHAKAIVADYGTNKAQVDIGSQNFSDYSWNKNRELGMITTNGTVMDGINKTLAADYAGAKAWPGSK